MEPIAAFTNSECIDNIEYINVILLIIDNHTQSQSHKLTYMQNKNAASMGGTTGATHASN